MKIVRLIRDNSFLGGSSAAYAIINEKGEFGVLPVLNPESGEVTIPNTPYIPLGGKKTLVKLANAGVLAWRPFKF